MKLFNKIWSKFEAQVFWQYLLLFFFSIILFGYIQAGPSFADPDSFFHAKISQLIYEQGIVYDFPWLTATNLQQDFIDHHFLYHLISVPFLLIFNPLVGIKIASVFFATVFILVFFWFLRSFKVKGALWFALFLLTVNPFIFRLNLAKAPALALILFFLTINFLFYRRYFALALCSFAYVWLYGGWPSAIGLSFIYLIFSFIWPVIWHGGFAAKFGKAKIVWQAIFSFLFSLLGIFAGIVLSPYFPKNLKFYWQQIVEIALLNYQNVINVGAEWYPYLPQDLILAALPFALFFILALIIFTLNFRRQPMVNWYVLVISLIFMILTLKSRRYVEYFIPLAWAFVALTVNNSLQKIQKYFSPIISYSYLRLFPLVLLLALSPIFIRDIKLIKNDYTNGIPFSRFIQSSAWLKANSSPGDIVFHSDWDEFPILFYHNHLNYYLAGLDPTFTYRYDQNIYRQWTEITAGYNIANLNRIIKQVFGARYVFIDKNQNQSMAALFAGQVDFSEVYQDNEAVIYEVK